MTPSAAPGQRTFAILKPDGHRAALLGKVLDLALEKAGLRPLRVVETTLTLDDVRFLYGHVEEKYPDAWPRVRDFSMSGPSYLILFMANDHHEAVARWRDLMGPTRSWEAGPGTVRGLWGSRTLTHENVVHGSDSNERAREEIRYFFGPHLA